jgi:sulfur carrier protein ThiS
MFLTVNGGKHEHRGDGTVPALLAELGATPEHTALTVNGELIFSKDWTRAADVCAFGISKRSDPKGSGKNFKLSDGDIVEVLTFVGGG